MSTADPQSKARLDRLAPASGSKHATKRLGRGTGTGLGKTCGRGHKGQKSRSGKKLHPGFEGGQMPYHRRIPKRGFSSPQAASWLRLPTVALERLDAGEVTIAQLRKLGVANHQQRRVKIYVSGPVTKAYQLGPEVSATKGARALIEAAGGSFASAPTAAEAKPAS